MKLDRRLLALVRSSRLPFYLTLALGLAGGLLTVLQARVLSRVIARVFLDGQDASGVSALLGVLLAFILARAVCTWGAEVSANRLAGRIKTRLRARLFGHLQQLGPAFLQQGSGEREARTGELANTLTEGIEALDAYFSQYLPQLALAAMVPLTILAFVFPLDALSGLVLLLTAPLIPLFMVLIGDLADSLTKKQWSSLSRMSAHFLDMLQGLPTLKILGQSRAQIEVIAQVSDRFRQATLGVLRVAFLSALVLELAATLSTAVVAVEAGLRLLYGRLSFEQAFFVLLLAPEFYLPLRMLGTRFHAGMAGAAAAGRIFEILETPLPEAVRARAGKYTPPACPGPQPSIRFEDVQYTYAGDRQALHGVTFDLPAGQKVALVGASGAGKSTLASLLLRFIEPQRGRICADGIPLASLPPEAWRAYVAWVPQHPYLFCGTVAENIRLARPEAGLEEVVSAARRAEAHDFIRELPQGYDTCIGERGARLSGGQAQRIALARAFLKDAPILLLDEPTANLDLEHASQIHSAIERLQAGRSALIIAHRLSTIENADQIVVLSEGRVAETGSHRELLERGEQYKRLLRAGADIFCQPKTVVAAMPPANGLALSIPTQTSGARISRPVSFDPLTSIVGAPRSPQLPEREVPPAPPTRPSPLAHLLHLLAPFKIQVVLSVLLGFATLASGIGLMSASAYIISAAALQPSIAALQVAIVGVRFFGVARGVFRYLERYLTHDATFRLLSRLRVWFYQALEPLAPARLAEFRSGDLLSRIVADITSLENFYVRAVAPPFSALLVTVFMTIFLAGFSSPLAATWLVFWLAAGAGLAALVLPLSRRPGHLLVSSRSDLSTALVDGIQGMADLQAFGAGDRLSERVEVHSRALAAAQARLAWIGGLQSAAGGFLAQLCSWAILLAAIPLVRADRLEGVYLAVLVLAALTSFEAAAPLPLAAQHLESSLETARRLFTITSGGQEAGDPVDPAPLPERFGLEIRDLRFRYPERVPSFPSPVRSRGEAGRGAAASRDALEGLTFSVPPGKKVAIVGPSGSGKTTLVNLLLRFWDYQEGEILLGGRDLRAYRQEDVRKQIAVVSQTTHLFNATVRENLLLARPGASEAELIQAARRAQIHDFIQQLPQGYNTWIGEQGLRLSGGERQRLAIARALLKNAPIILLDEPTANLDPLTEQAVIQSISEVMEGRTVLMITHRFAGLEAMDEILVLLKGKIVARGPHAELLDQEGYYRRMWELRKPGI
ncbi:MAG TPA: thiol reductant ABC exporter subunit CydD [Anaerolineales bacterium]